MLRAIPVRDQNAAIPFAAAQSLGTVFLNARETAQIPHGRQLVPDCGSPWQDRRKDRRRKQDIGKETSEKRHRKKDTARLEPRGRVASDERRDTNALKDNFVSPTAGDWLQSRR